MAFNEFQNTVVKSYAAGDFAWMNGMKQVDRSGDTLFMFIMREFADDGVPMDREEVLNRLGSAIDDLHAIRNEIVLS